MKFARVVAAIPQSPPEAQQAVLTGSLPASPTIKKTTFPKSNLKSSPC